MFGCLSKLIFSSRRCFRIIVQVTSYNLLWLRVNARCSCRLAIFYHSTIKLLNWISTNSIVIDSTTWTIHSWSVKIIPSRIWAVVIVHHLHLSPLLFNNFLRILFQPSIDHLLFIKLFKWKQTFQKSNIKIRNFWFLILEQTKNCNENFFLLITKGHWFKSILNLIFKLAIATLLKLQNSLHLIF